MGTYTSPAINYYRINATNTALAQSNSGGGSPTEEITAPVASPGTFSSYDSGTLTINGSATTFNSFAVGQYLYYTDTTTGNYVLVGQIATIALDGLSLTLTADATNQPVSNSVLSAAYALITNNESIYMRIQTTTGDANGTQNIPNFGLGWWRLNNGLTGTNNRDQSSLTRVSSVGTPLVNAGTEQNIPFTFVTMNQFTVAATTTTGTTYFRSTLDFPAYIWIRVTPQIGSSTSLSSQTLYRFSTLETMEALIIQAGQSGTSLQAAGYNNISGASTISNAATGN
jgi:hypothetical protein